MLMQRLELGILEKMSPLYVGRIESLVPEAARRISGASYILWQENTPYSYIYRQESSILRAVCIFLSKHPGEEYCVTLDRQAFHQDDKGKWHKFPRIQISEKTRRYIYLPPPFCLDLNYPEPILDQEEFCTSVEEVWGTDICVLPRAASL